MDDDDPNQALIALIRKEYNQVAEQSDTASVLDMLHAAEATLRTAEEQSLEVGGSLPASIIQHRDELLELRRKIEAAHQVLAPGGFAERMARANAALRLFPGDSVLERLQQHLLKQQSARIPELLAQADEAHERDDRRAELALLRRVLEINPHLPQIQARFSRIRERHILEERIRKAEASALVPGLSAPAARDALWQTLELFLKPEFALAPSVREPLVELLMLAQQDARLALARPEQYTRALELHRRLERQDDWLARRAASIIRRWLPLVRDVAARGLLSSLAAIGDVLQAYRIALHYRRSKPDDPQALDLLAHADASLRRALSSMARRQLVRTRRTLEQGEYQAANENLDKLEQFYAPIAQEFPQFLHDLDDGEIGDLQYEVAHLRRDAAVLEELDRQARMLLDRASQETEPERLVELDRQLGSLTGLERLPELKQEAERLHVRVSEERAQHVRALHRQAIANARMVDELAVTSDELRRQREELFLLGQQLDWALLTPSEREDLDATIEALYAHEQALQHPLEQKVIPATIDPEAAYHPSRQPETAPMTRDLVLQLDHDFQIRPDSVELATLMDALQVGQGTPEELRQVRSLVIRGKFRQARRLLDGLTNNGDTEPQRQEVRRLLDDLEASYRSATTYPIRDLIRDGRYQEALRLCQNALRQIESDTLYADLLALQSDIQAHLV